MKFARTRQALAACRGYGLRALASAHVWYLLLVASGVLTLSYGISIQFGQGFGFMAFGALAIIGSEAIRNGLRHG